MEQLIDTFLKSQGFLLKGIVRDVSVEAITSLFWLLSFQTLTHPVSNKAVPQGRLVQTCHKGSSFEALAVSSLTYCGPPGKNRREQAQMEKEFRQNVALSLSGQGGE